MIIKLNFKLCNLIVWKNYTKPSNSSKLRTTLTNLTQLRGPLDTPSTCRVTSTRLATPSAAASSKSPSFPSHRHSNNDVSSRKQWRMKGKLMGSWTSPFRVSMLYLSRQMSRGPQSGSGSREVGDPKHRKWTCWSCSRGGRTLWIKCRKTWRSHLITWTHTLTSPN